MTISIVFDRKGQAVKGKAGTIELLLSEGSKHIYMSTGLKVRKSEWKNGEVRNRADAPEMNALIIAMQKKILRVAAEIIEEGGTIDNNTIKERMTAKKQEENPTGLVDWLENQVNRMNMKRGTYCHYRTLINRLREFGRMMSWQQLTVANIYEFDHWLHELDAQQPAATKAENRKRRKISDGSVFTYHKCLKALLNRAVLFDKITSNPYQKLRGQFNRGDNQTVEFLSDDECEAVERLHPNEGTKYAIARDLFVFQMHTGLSYADTQVFDFSKYTRRKGRWVSVGRREKTGVQYVTELSEECLEILGRYGMKLPKIPNAEYNKRLKTLGVIAGVDKPLHSHMARHTFATQALAAGVKIENISKMLGHTNITQTQRYAKVLPESVFDEFEKIKRA